MGVGWGLRKRRIDGVRFRRQVPIGPYIVDFMSFEKKIVIELDGGQHNEPDAKAYDETRTAWLRSQGFHVLRFWNHDVLRETDAVLETVLKATDRR